MALVMRTATENMQRNPNTQHQGKGFDDVGGHCIIPTIQGLTTYAMKPARAKAKTHNAHPILTPLDMPRMGSLMRTPVYFESSAQPPLREPLEICQGLQWTRH